MPRVVLDTVVFVRALFNSRSFCGRLVFEYFNRYRLVLSPPVVEEILEVLGRQELIDRFYLRQVDYPEAVARLLQSMQQAEIVELGEIPAVSRDPNDDKFLATAKVASAEYLVSQDEDLLVLGHYEGVTIVDCARFVQLLEQGQASSGRTGRQ